MDRHQSLERGKGWGAVPSWALQGLYMALGRQEMSPAPVRGRVSWRPSTDMLAVPWWALLGLAGTTVPLLPMALTRIPGVIPLLLSCPPLPRTWAGRAGAASRALWLHKWDLDPEHNCVLKIPVSFNLIFHWQFRWGHFFLKASSSASLSDKRKSDSVIICLWGLAFVFQLEESGYCTHTQAFQGNDAAAEKWVLWCYRSSLFNTTMF